LAHVLVGGPVPTSPEHALATQPRDGPAGRHSGDVVPEIEDRQCPGAWLACIGRDMLSYSDTGAASMLQASGVSTIPDACRFYFLFMANIQQHLERAD
jgi:hypothetical protein